MLVHADSRCGRGREIVSLSSLPADQVSALGLWCVGHGQSCRKCCTIVIEDVPLGHIVDSLAKVEIVNSFNVVDFLVLYIYTLLYLSGNSGRLITRVRIQKPQEQRYPVLQVHAMSCRVNVVHRSLTWTTGSLTCVCDHSDACMYTRGLSTPRTSQHI